MGRDYIKFAESNELMELLQGERLIFADQIQKTNMYGWTQERTFVLSDAGIYNIHKKEVKRKILI